MTNGQDPMVLRRSDIDAAVAAGVIDAGSAERLIAFTQAGSEVPGQADEENLRLITSFNDIFVTIGLVLFLGALAYVSWDSGSFVRSALIAAVSWGLAEIFTRFKRLALPSIVLLVVYAVSVFGALTSLFASQWSGGFEAFLVNGGARLAIAGLATAGLVWLHWLRFGVPITVAAGCAALAIMVVAFIASVAPNIVILYPAAVFLLIGLAIFGLAMRFDMSDRRRATRRTDIAFWLHLLAAPLIVHPIVSSLTSAEDMTRGDAGVIIGLFVFVGLIALVTDRRALLVSSLAYLGIAAYTLMSSTAWASTSRAETALVVGAIVLMLSVAWRPLRRAVVALMPGAIRERVPIAQ